MDVIRAAVVWAAELTMFRASGGRYGHGLTRWSWLQILGFVLIATGVVLFSFAHTPHSLDAVGNNEVDEGESGLLGRRRPATRGQENVR
jgi:hypothetical protein